MIRFTTAGESHGRALMAIVEGVPGDSRNVRVTYLYRGDEDTEEVRVLGGPHGSTGGLPMKRFLRIRRSLRQLVDGAHRDEHIRRSADARRGVARQGDVLLEAVGVCITQGLDHGRVHFWLPELISSGLQGGRSTGAPRRPAPAARAGSGSARWFANERSSTGSSLATRLRSPRLCRAGSTRPASRAREHP